ncbi:MAG: YdcF family protein [Schleiferilactobacillus harbinensis]|uniref:YdcF family protein n=1 Tax=Schleiferilactobacillus harbinensis TaxID=304207 RepID=UPI0039ED3DE1
MLAIFNSAELPVVFGYGGLVVLAFLALFLVCWLAEPRRLLNGTLFMAFFVVFWLWLGTTIIYTRNILLIYITGGLFLITMVILGLIWGTSFIWLLWNAWIVWRRESHTLANMLTLFTGLGLLILWALTAFLNRLPAWLQVIVGTGNALMYYGTLLLFNFVFSLILYQMYPIPYKQQYIIVLGAGLLHGDTVSPLLAARIERGMKFYYRQINKGRPAPKIIFSGGQGADEKISEAEAMRNYAIAHGIPAGDTLLEDMSTTTQENLRFSKALMQKREIGKGRIRAIFVSNNYHIFRAGMYARAEGVPANGRGAHTSFNYLPNAILRELIAVTLMHKRRHIVVVGIILFFAGLSFIISFIH